MCLFLQMSSGDESLYGPLHEGGAGSGRDSPASDASVVPVAKKCKREVRDDKRRGCSMTAVKRMVQFPYNSLVNFFAVVKRCGVLHVTRKWITDRLPHLSTMS